ncbi:hypothetical protein BC835DRAFT_1419356 [Cytidiella melzeri]|nr:hypothetical protein BC835DRAFT_1419356 [Cytidiella melzeri]
MNGYPSVAPGTSAYFPSLVARVRDAHPDLPLDPVILQSVLLCLVAGHSDGGNARYSGRKNLILRTREEDIGIVLHLAYLVLSEVLGIATNKHKAKKESTRASGPGVSGSTHVHPDPDELIRSCFLRGKSGSRVPHAVSKHHRDRSKKGGSTIGPRRSATFSSVSPAGVGSSLSTSEQTKGSYSDSVRDATSPISPLRVRPKVSRVATEPVKAQSRPHLDAHFYSEPHQHHHSASHTLSVPGALVVSGLEHTSLPAQRALLRVLHEHRIVLDADGEQPGKTWSLPSDFIVVYVCPVDAYERPRILRPLLDRFGMSADVNVTPTLRHAYMTYQTATSPLSSSLQSHTPRSPLSPLWSPDSTPVAPSPRPHPSSLHPGSNSHTTSTTSAPIISAQELLYLRSLTRPVPATLPQADVNRIVDAYTDLHPTLNLYLQDLFAAARHNPTVDGSLLTIRAHRDAEDLVRAHRVVCGDSLGADLVSNVAANPAMNGDARHSDDTGSEERLSWPTDEEASSLSWDKPEDEWLGAELEIGRQKASSIRSHGIRVHVNPKTHGAQSVLFDTLSDSDRSRTDLLSSLPRPPEVWDISEVDVGKIFPRVVSHRLCIRAGPDDEVLGSVMFPAAQHGPEPERLRGPEDKTVKQVIIGILADV